jgi:integrase
MPGKGFRRTALLRFLLVTGVRCGEALSLEWANVDIERGVAFLPKTKSGRSRQVILNDLASDVLRGMEERRFGDHPFVFPGSRPGTHMAEPRRVFARVKAMAKIDESLRLHDLRHTYASIAVQNGASLYEVQKLLGHSSSIITQRYSHLTTDGLRTVTNSVADQIKQATG